MGKAALVEQDIREGKEIVDLLIQSGEKVHLALWLYDSDHGDWRLVLAIPQRATGPKAAYHFMRKFLDDILPPIRLTLEDIKLISPNDQLVKKIEKDKRSARVLSGQFLTKTRIGDAYLEGAYIYKAA